MSLIAHIKTFFNEREAARLLQNGVRFWAAHRHEDARTTWREALRIYVALGHDEGISAAAENVAGAAYYLADYREAVRYARLSLRTSRRLGDKDGMSRALTLLGGTAEKTGNLRRAQAWQEKSLRLAREAEDPDGIVRSLMNLAQSLTSAGRYVAAVEHAREAIRLMEQLGATSGRAWIFGHNTLGAVYRVLGEHRLANETFDCALASAKAEGDLLGESLALTNRSIGHGLQREWSEAAAKLERNVELKRALNDPKGEEIALHNLARCYTELERYEEALRLCEQSRAIAGRIGHREGEWVADAARARVHRRLNQYAEARIWSEAALRGARQYGSNVHAGAMQVELARTLIDVGDFTTAAPLLRSAVDAAEDVRELLGETDAFRVSLFEQQIEAYEDLQWVLAALGKTEEALEVAERGRARALARALARQADAVEAPPDLETMRAVAAELRTTFVVFSVIPDPRARVYDLRVPEVFAWVIPPNREANITFHRSGSLPAGDAAPTPAIVKTSLETMPTRKRHFVEEQAPDLAHEDLRLLHDVLIAPIAHALPEDPEHLITIVASGELIVFPFAAMMDAQGRPLIERHTIATTPSIQTLRITRRERATDASRALIVGNPTEDLDSAENEARSLAEKLDATVLLRTEATRDAVIPAMQGKRILHFATHGEFDALDETGAYGSLLLAGGTLTAGEIAGMSLDADLAVLSACDTGQGRIAAEGLLGLSRAFMLAGVRTVIATLWEVPDLPTAALMAELYEHSNETRAHALRRAMLRTIDAGYRYPVQWAGFVLIGRA